MAAFSGLGIDQGGVACDNEIEESIARNLIIEDRRIATQLGV